MLEMLGKSPGEGIRKSNGSNTFAGTNDHVSSRITYMCVTDSGEKVFFRILD